MSLAAPAKRVRAEKALGASQTKDLAVRNKGCPLSQGESDPAPGSKLSVRLSWERTALFRCDAVTMYAVHMYMHKRIRALSLFS